MPFKDPERKKEFMKQWRKRSIENGYGKWLYARRALRYADAEHYAEALEEIAKLDEGPAGSIARQALADSKERWEELGPAPGGKERPKEADAMLLASLDAMDLSSSRS